jgi:hypothetical protein
LSGSAWGAADAGLPLDVRHLAVGSLDADPGLSLWPLPVLAALDRYPFRAGAAACPGCVASCRPIQLKVASVWCADLRLAAYV